MSSVDRAVTELVKGQWLAKERRSAGDVNVYTLMIAPPLRADDRRQTPASVHRGTPRRVGTGFRAAHGRVG
ncbi:hypothetical protein GCM10023317_41670 [Actinopolymorpha pittospori]